MACDGLCCEAVILFIYARMEFMSKLLDDAKAAGFYVDINGIITVGAGLWKNTRNKPLNEKLAKFAALQQPKWQPIETAPKDGKRFLASTTITNHRQVIAIKTAQGIILDENLQPLYWPMTNWMPLPKPPTNTEE